MTPGCARNPIAGPPVAAGFARGLIDLAATKGAEPAALIEAAGLDPADLEDQDYRIGFDRYVALMRAAKALTGDPALALHFGEAMDIGELSIVGLLSQGCATPAQAFAELGRYMKLAVDLDLGETDRLQLARRGGALWVVDGRPDPNDFPELTESGFARMVAGGRRLGVPSPIREVQVTHEEPPYRAEYDRIFQAPVRFGCGWNAVRIDEAAMTMPIATQPRYVFDVLSARADQLLAELEAAKTIRGRVEGLLTPMLHTGEARIDRVARALGISRQTLYRRLKAEGATFETVLDALRRKLALHHLRDRKASVNETAYLVGFSDRAAFSRAFKRWTGAGPGAMRG